VEDGDGGAQVRSRRSSRALKRLEGRRVNFDPDAHERYTPHNGWHLDDMTRPLPDEPSGPPVADGSWQIARRLMLDYQVADPQPGARHLP